MNLNNDFFEYIISCNYFKVIIFVLVCYLININVVMAFIIFMIYFVISHLLEDNRISNEIEHFETLNKFFQ